jgi:hypothetical protein
MALSYLQRVSSNAPERSEVLSVDGDVRGRPVSRRIGATRNSALDIFSRRPPWKAAMTVASVSCRGPDLGVFR